MENEQMYVSTEDPTGENVHPDDHGNIPLCGPNPPRDDHANTLEGDEQGGGGTSLTNDPTRTEMLSSIQLHQDVFNKMNNPKMYNS